MPFRIVWSSLLSFGLIAVSQGEELGPLNRLPESDGRTESTFRSGSREFTVLPSRPQESNNICVVLNPKEPLPADAQGLVSAFDSDANAIRQKAEQDLQARRQLLITTLQTLQDSYTREAKLDEAVAIRDVIRQLKVAHLKPLPDPGNLIEFADRIGEVFYFDITGQSGPTIWGTEVYTADSNLATAAVHAGVLKVGQRGIVKVTMIKSPEVHHGIVQNGVRSSQWGAYSASYVVEGAFSRRSSGPHATPATRFNPQ
jgi:hypothetical protein